MPINNDSKIIERVEQAGLKRPRTLCIAISGDCNLHCAHCLVESPRAGHLPAAEIRRLVGEFLGLGGEEICLTGGEPLTHPDWFDLVSFICRQPALRSLRLQTNATLITRRHAEALRSLGGDPPLERIARHPSSP